MTSKIKKMITCFKGKKIDAFLVTRDIDVAYLTGFPPAEAWLLITRGPSYFMTDSRYYDEIKKGVQPGQAVKLRCFKKSLVDEIVAIFQSSKIDRIGFDSRALSVFTFRKLKLKAGKGCSFCEANDIVSGLRSIKEANEIVLIKKALGVHHECFKYLRRIIRPGITERQVAIKLEIYIKNLGASLAFDPIIASGPHSSYPHACLTDRRIQKRDVVLVDMGIDLKGYKTDLTRMFFLGRITAPIRQKFEILRQTQVQIIKEMTPGMPASHADQQARKSLERNHLAKYFTHSLGHGIGLEVHENPHLSSHSKETIRNGMIFTVEPGLYFPGKFGLRIEDMVLMTKNGGEILSDHIN